MITKINIKSSSSDEIYTVTFAIENNLISINCNCKAGLVKTLCKHRLSLLDGDVSAIIDKSDIKALTDVLDKIDKTKIVELNSELNKVEKEISTLDALRKKLRKEIGLKFSNGF